MAENYRLESTFSEMMTVTERPVPDATAQSVTETSVENPSKLYKYVAVPIGHTVRIICIPFLILAWCCLEVTDKITGRKDASK